MEFVFVVPRRELFRDCTPQGWVPFGPRGRPRGHRPVPGFDQAHFEETVRRHGFFVQREHAEENPELKQVIPYSVVVRGGQVLLLRRLATGGEVRLHNKLSIGVGGHVNPIDAETSVDPGDPADLRDLPGVPDVIGAGARRELEEELHIERRTDIQRIGILNDDSNPVGAVHVGLVQLVHVRGEVRVRENDLLEGRFVAPEELRRLLGDGANFETWSAKLIERLEEVVSERPLTAL